MAIGAAWSCAPSSKRQQWSDVVLPRARVACPPRDTLVRFGLQLLMLAVVAQAQTTWSAAYGPGRMGPVAYDIARNRLVLFGGTWGGRLFGDTWVPNRELLRGARGFSKRLV